MAIVIACRASAQPSADLPTIPEGLTATIVAHEPLVRNPCALAFDAQGRMFVGHGPQYRNPKPDTPHDRVSILIDTDGDGIADKSHTFAEGLNLIQGLAWRGDELWVANAPDFTIVRDLDGDDVADEYVKLYTDLGNLEHGLHGLNWAPDGKLYFSKGNSKGLSIPGRIAPKPFRDLWDVEAPKGSPDHPEPQTFTAENYKATYHDPSDDWGREGGVLRCDPDGTNLEIVSRGTRNVFSIGYDSSFNWLGTDNDQSKADRILMPFMGAHFGWGHQWSADWTGEDHPPTVPVSGPLFPGSGTGIAYYDWPQLPTEYRGVWFINDWLRKTTFVYRPEWAGALMQPAGGAWTEFAKGGVKLYNPVDLQVGPDGALYTTGWGSSYGVVWDDNGQQANEGRVFRFGWDDAPETTWHAEKRSRDIGSWSTDELIEDLGAQLPVWRVNAQVELLRRGKSASEALKFKLSNGRLSTMGRTWALWTLAQMSPQNSENDTYFADLAKTGNLNDRLQALRILAHRIREHRPGQQLHSIVATSLNDPEPRLRFAAAQAVFLARDTSQRENLINAAANESDRLVNYALWQAMRDTIEVSDLKSLLSDWRGGVRRSSLLALLDSGSLDTEEVRSMLSDSNRDTASIAALWLSEQSSNPLLVIEPEPKDFSEDELNIKMTPGIKPGTIRYTYDGSEPTMDSERDSRLTLTETTKLRIGLFVDGKLVGQAVDATWRKIDPKPEEATVTLIPPTDPTTAEAVLAVLPNADPTKGQAIFNAAGCFACHQVDGDGGRFGPDLSNFGDRGKVEHLIRSLLFPNEIITEGFALQQVVTKDGQSFSGVLSEESERILDLVQANSQLARINKANISSRESLHHSPMPSFQHVLGANQMADLAAWLMSKQSLGSVSKPSAQKPEDAYDLSAISAPSALKWTMKENSIAFNDGTRPVTEFVFNDEKVLRPHFRNLHAPNGTQVSRPYPPLPPEYEDHGDLHPGLWLAFGDINGEDFWRNKARIEHIRFITEPHWVGSRIEFTEETRLVERSGSELASQETTYSLQRVGQGYLISIDTTIKATAKPLVFGGQEEMGFGVRLTHTLIERHGGMVQDSLGRTGAKIIWGKLAEWCDYSRELDGSRLGVTLFPALENDRPSWWHSRDYGLMLANPFGEKKPGGESAPLHVALGDSLKLRCGAWIYSSTENTANERALARAAFQSAITSK